MWGGGGQGVQGALVFREEGRASTIITSRLLAANQVNHTQSADGPETNPAYVASHTLTHTLGRFPSNVSFKKI